ncbi:MAG TPA: MBL fold metallo-hydrolase [Candidatus Paceibacterota bacterium]|nr:MBL fold metallo-hydrolase [Candidatus Paceibacterota bacterium]
MVITYYGMGFVKAQLGDTVIAFNPISKDFDPKAPKFGADLALISLRDEAYNGQESVAFGNKTPFVIDGPGEYEISGIFVQGFPSEGPAGKINTAYAVLLEGIKMLHLGAMASAQLSPEAIEDMGAIDILFVPLGDSALNPKEAAKLATSFEAKIVIPLICQAEGGDEVLATFLKETGGSGEAVDKLAIKRKDLEGKEGEVIVIKS